MMKQTITVLIALIASFSLTACGNSGGAASEATSSSVHVEASESSSAVSPSEDASPGEDAEPVELTVFAAASMTETMDKIIQQYKTVAPNVTILATYDSSGTLKTQIQEGAPCDLFISAAQKQMNQLDGSLKDDKEKNPDGLDFVEAGTRVDLLENKVALAVPEGNPAGIEGFADLAGDKLKLIALGNSDVPVGSYSLEILEYLKLDTKTLESAGKITYGSNVKEVTTQISEGTVDCGIVYATDAYSAGLTVVDTATSDMCRQVIYPAAVMKTSDNAKQQAAKNFLAYLQTEPCAQVFESVGFAVVKQ